MMTTRLIHDAEGRNTAVWPIGADQTITPVEAFFTRSHAAAPEIDPDRWRLEIGGLVDRPQVLSLADLAALPQVEVAATLVCAGMRRAEYLALGPLPGELPWGPEPASTGVWRGVPLRSVLDSAGVGAAARHIEFVGLDAVERDGQTFGFGGSIDLAKALSGEVLLATGLNGAPIPREHGYPVRAVVPGWIGARSVKWLGRITLSAEPSPNYFQRKAYRVQRVRNPADPRDVSDGEALSRIAVNSVIAEPSPGQVVPAGRLRVRGWAIGTEGQPLAGIEVSPNACDDWVPARIRPGGSRWTWSLWEAELDLPPGEHTIAVRASDVAGGAQPETVSATWNVKGYANNAWHRVTITSEFGARS
jgi:sulfite oxidase